MRIVGNAPSGGKKPTTPTIGTAIDGGTGTTASVAFTPSTYIGKGTITYTATSSPGSLTGTGSGSPITVSGLTTGTAYTFTVKGDTNYGVASDSSAASNSVTPASPSSYESIATVTLGSAATSLDITSIPSTYKSLQIRGSLLTSANNSQIYMYFNGSSTGTSYRAHWLYGDGASVVAGQGAGVSSYGASIFGGSASVTSSTYPAYFIIDILDYASTTKNKTVRIFAGLDSNNTSGAAVKQLIQVSSLLWDNTSAISSISFNGFGLNLAANSTLALYGIKGE